MIIMNNEYFEKRLFELNADRNNIQLSIKDFESEIESLECDRQFIDVRIQEIELAKLAFQEHIPSCVPAPIIEDAPIIEPKIIDILDPEPKKNNV